MSTEEPQAAGTTNPPGRPLLVLDDLQMEFGTGRGEPVRALAGVDLEVRAGETIGVVGESGCGKSTLARAALMLQPPTSGSIYFDGHRLTSMSPRALATQRGRMQMVFQDPNASLDPRYRIGRSLMEPLLAKGQSRRAAAERAREVLAEVQMPADTFDRLPHEFSGGQRQRIAVARALAPEPEFIVLDEPTSALDVSIQAQILNLMLRLQQEHGLTYMFISHNLGVVRHLAHRIAVMYLGRIVEVAPAEELFSNPQHPYTRALLSAVPDISAGPSEQIVLQGDLPSPRMRHQGCPFAARCWLVQERCRTEAPKMLTRATEGGLHQSACHRADAVGDPLPGAALVGADVG